MDRLRTILICLILTLPLISARGDDAPAPTAAELADIREATANLTAQVDALRESGVEERQLNDVAVYAKAAEWIVRHGEFYRPSYVNDTRSALAAGRERAERLRSGGADWGRTPGRHILAYRSEVDGSLQPYAVTLPQGFESGGSSRYPLHLVLHGRGSTLNEVSFIRQHSGKAPSENQDWIQLDVFGRINNAYRWAGETDVVEALADVINRYPIDERRITLWGFSMGGAGAWHLGLHHPSRWSSVGAGAGFVDFYKYQNVTEPLPEYQDKALRIYDTVDYVQNLADVPFITYGGELDKQLAGSLTMRDAAEKLDAPLRVLIGPGMGHKFDDQSYATFMEFHAEHTRQGRPAFPGRRDVRFITYTPKYNTCEWLTIQELQEMYEPATVISSLTNDGVLDIRTTNVAALSIARGAADRASLDGCPPVDLNAAADGLLPEIDFELDADGWQTLGYEESRQFQENPQRRKRHDLQGPIDDAFMQPFVCVRGTGTPWSRVQHDWAMWTLSRFQREWDKWMRGDAPVIDDTQVTDELLSERNVILFGDPGSNSVLGRVVDDLPLKWTAAGTITIGGDLYDADHDGVALIYPNPLNPQRYVVVNSGMTMHESDFKASNAWLFPKLGDAAVIEFKRSGDEYSETTVWAELFDSGWNLPEQ
jgi:predicted esterase